MSEIIDKNNENLEVIDVDTVLSYAGDFGKYQYILIALFSAINILSAYHYFGQTFIALTPDYKCKLFGNETDTVISKQCFLFHNDTNSEKSCSEWNYDSEYNYNSIVQELNWVCKDNWKPALGQSVFFVGSVVGSFLFGIIADRFGRLHALVWSNLLAFLGNIGTVFSTNVTTYSINRFVAGCATDTNFIMMYIIVMEYIRPNMRTIGLNLCIGIFYCLASMAVPWTAVLLGSWKLFLVIIAIPHLFVVLYYFVVPESVQWLVSKGRDIKAVNCLFKVARINNRLLSHEILEGFKEHVKQYMNSVTKHESFFGLLKTPKLRRKTCILIFKSMVMTLCYDAIARNVNGLGYSPFVTFTMTSAAILPGSIIILAVQDHIGRKALAMSALFISGVFIAAVAIILSLTESSNATLLLSLTIISRLSIIVAYNSGSQYAVELIPIEVRGQGVSVVHLVGYAASFFSPQILYLSNFWRPLPEIIIGVLLVCGSIACLFLPETLNKTLPVTLADGEAFGEDEGVLEFAFSEKQKSESTCRIDIDTDTVGSS